MAEDFLASKAAQYDVRPISTSTFPPPRLVRHLHYSSTISRLAPRIIAVTVVGVLAAGLQLANRLLDRDILDPTHIGLSIGSGIGEVAWIGGLMHIFYGLCTPRPKTQRTHVDDDEDDPASNSHCPPSSSGNHLLHARSQSQAPPSSPHSHDSHYCTSTPSTTHPHTPATPTLVSVPTDELSAHSNDSSAPEHAHPHDGHRSSAPATAGTGLAHREPGSTIGLDEDGGAGGRSIPATISEEFLYLCGDDPFSSPPPGTVVLPKVPVGGGAKKGKGVTVAKVKDEASRHTAAVVDSAQKLKVHPKRSSSDAVLSDVRKEGGEERASVSNPGGGPSSKKARMSVEGAHNGRKLSKRSSAKPAISRRSSNKRRSGGVDKSKREGTVDAMNDVTTPFSGPPSAVNGIARPRPPRSSIPRHLRPIDPLGPAPSKTLREEETNSLGLIGHDHQVVSGSSPSRQNINQSAFTALNTTTNIDDERLLRSVVTNALTMKRHQQMQYLDPATALLPNDVGARGHGGVDGQGVGIDERDHPSGSTTPTPQAQEDAGPTPRGGSPIGESSNQPPLQVAGQKQFKFTTLVDSSVSSASESRIPFTDPMIYQRATFDGPTNVPDPTAVSLESFPRTPSLAGGGMSIASLPSASELQNQLTPSPDDRNAFRFNPPSSFEPSAPIDIPETRTRARNHYRRRAPSASILEAARAMPLGSPPLNGGPGFGERRLHKPNSGSYDSAKARARAIMGGVDLGLQPWANEHLESRNSGRGTANPPPSGGEAGVEVPPNHQPLRHHGDSPLERSIPGLPLLTSRFSDPTTTGTGSSGGTTSSTGGFDAGSESSFK